MDNIDDENENDDNSSGKRLLLQGRRPHTWYRYGPRDVYGIYKSPRYDSLMRSCVVNLVRTVEQIKQPNQQAETITQITTLLGIEPEYMDMLLSELLILDNPSPLLNFDDRYGLIVHDDVCYFLISVLEQNLATIIEYVTGGDPSDHMSVFIYIALWMLEKELVRLPSENMTHLTQTNENGWIDMSLVLHELGYCD